MILNSMNSTTLYIIWWIGFIHIISPPNFLTLFHIPRDSQFLYFSKPPDWIFWVASFQKNDTALFVSQYSQKAENDEQIHRLIFRWITKLSFCHPSPYHNFFKYAILCAGKMQDGSCHLVSPPKSHMGGIQKRFGLPRLGTFSKYHYYFFKLVSLSLWMTVETLIHRQSAIMFSVNLISRM